MDYGPIVFLMIVELGFMVIGYALGKTSRGGSFGIPKRNKSVSETKTADKILKDLKLK